MARRIPKKTQVAILTRTRDLLARPQGWTRKRFSTYVRRAGRYVYDDADGRYIKAYCIAGAARAAALEIDEDRFYNMSETEIVKALSIDALAAAKLADKPGLLKKLQDDDTRVATYLYNDASGRKQSEVVALLDEKLQEVTTDA